MSTMAATAINGSSNRSKRSAGKKLSASRRPTVKAVGTATAIRPATHQSALPQRAVAT
jgi:hypothetical protein